MKLGSNWGSVITLNIFIITDNLSAFKSQNKTNESSLPEHRGSGKKASRLNSALFFKKKSKKLPGVSQKPKSLQPMKSHSKV